MQLTAALKGKKLDGDAHTIFLTDKIKRIVYAYDAQAEVILFGSRARGDWHEESDWDFLMLTDREDIENISEKIRLDILNEIELVTFDSIFVIVKNRNGWEDDYAITGIYKSIQEEGLAV